MNHYVYLLEDKRKPMWYIGARSCSCAIGEDKYMGSSKSMTKEDKANCRKIILARFKTRKESIAYEIKMHNKFDVAVNEQFYNKAKQTSVGFDTTGISPSAEKREHMSSIMKGRIFTDEWKEKISKSKIGIKRSKETIEKVRKANIGKIAWNKGIPRSEEVKQKISKTKQGHTTSSETKLKLSIAGKKQVICVETGIIYDSINSASKAVGINQSGISNVLNGRQLLSGGYTWEYYNSEVI